MPTVAEARPIFERTRSVEAVATELGITLTAAYVLILRVTRGKPIDATTFADA